MSWKPDKPCPAPGCPLKIPAEAKYCDEHSKQLRKSQEERRVSSHLRGYDRRWSAASEAFLRAHPLCNICKEPSSEVDHIKPHHGDMNLFWDTTNWQALCKPCHSRKTATEDGRWDRQPGGTQERSCNIA